MNNSYVPMFALNNQTKFVELYKYIKSKDYDRFKLAIVDLINKATSYKDLCDIYVLITFNTIKTTDVSNKLLYNELQKNKYYSKFCQELENDFSSLNEKHRSYLQNMIKIKRKQKKKMPLIGLVIMIPLTLFSILFIFLDHDIEFIFNTLICIIIDILLISNLIKIGK